MGNWQLEAVRMVGYIAFPVGLFHWFNQPDTFTALVEQERKKYEPEPGAKEKLEAFMDEFNKEKDRKTLEAMETKLLTNK